MDLLTEGSPERRLWVAVVNDVLQELTMDVCHGYFSGARSLVKYIHGRNFSEVCHLSGLDKNYIIRKTNGFLEKHGLKIVDGELTYLSGWK